MDALWKRSTATAEQIREDLSDKHPMKESTVRTILKRLEEKGYVRHKVDGRTNIYRGVEAPSSVAAGAVRQIIDRFCGGSVEQLLLGMVDDEILDEKELRKLTQKLAARKNRKKEN
jgi:predicted transcriptional regulator